MLAGELSVLSGPGACRPPVPVPALLREGLSEAEVRAYAEKATVYVNKGLGALGGWAALRGRAGVLHENQRPCAASRWQGVCQAVGLAAALPYIGTPLVECHRTATAAAAAYAHRLATGKDAALSAAAIAALYAVAKLSALFSLVGLAYTGEWAARRAGGWVGGR